MTNTAPYAILGGVAECFNCKDPRSRPLRLWRQKGKLVAVCKSCWDAFRTLTPTLPEFEGGLELTYGPPNKDTASPKEQPRGIEAPGDSDAPTPSSAVTECVFGSTAGGGKRASIQAAGARLPGIRAEASLGGRVGGSLRLPPLLRQTGELTRLSGTDFRIIRDSELEIQRRVEAFHTRVNDVVASCWGPNNTRLTKDEAFVRCLADLLQVIAIQRFMLLRTSTSRHELAVNIEVRSRLVEAGE